MSVERASGDDRARSFDRVAELYDRSRPSYPDAVFDVVLGDDRPVTVLEVGAGSGLATAGLLDAGATVVAVEPSVEMAAICVRRLEGRVGSELIIGQFEDVGPELAESSFDVVFSAQAWHWVDPPRALPLAARLLHPGGQLCGIWNYPVALTPDLSAAILEVYERHAPDVGRESMYVTLSERTEGLGEGVENWFEEPTRREFHWSRRYEPNGFVDLLRTHSDNSTLSPTVRDPLMAELEAVVRASGGVVVEYRCELIAATRLEVLSTL